MNERSVFANRTAKHLGKTFNQVYELLELAVVLSNKTDLINGIEMLQHNLMMLKAHHKEEFEIK
jgi:hypothetical protein